MKGASLIRKIRQGCIDSIDRDLAKGSIARDLARGAAFRLGALDFIRNVRNPYGSNRQEQYETWLKWNTDNPVESSRGKGRLFSIIITGTAVNPTLESLWAQNYEIWEAIISNGSTVDPPYSSSKYRVIDEADPMFLDSCLSVLKGDFFIVMQGGDRLSARTLQSVAEFLLENPKTGVVYTDSDQILPNGKRVRPFFKPDWSPRLLREMNYVGLSCFFNSELARAAGGFREGNDWNTVYDLLLRLSERTREVRHIARPLYHMRDTDEYWSNPTPGITNSKHSPLVTIIIVSHDRPDLLRNCVGSIESTTRYGNYEVIIVDHKSQQKLTQEYLASISHEVIRCDESFNFSRINNFAATRANGEFLVFMNDDIEVLEPFWIQEMLQEAKADGVGVVGALLLYPNGTIQHCGIILGVGRVCGHLLRYSKTTDENYWFLQSATRECSAVTAACAMVRKSTFIDAGGFDEKFVMDFNDVDLCLRLKQKGYATIFTPRASFTHRESSTRGHRTHLPSDEALFAERWQKYLDKGDPYYNNNLTMRWENCAIAPIGHERAAMALLLELYATNKRLIRRFTKTSHTIDLVGLANWAITEGMKDTIAERYLFPRLKIYRDFVSASAADARSSTVSSIK